MRSLLCLSSLCLLVACGPAVPSQVRVRNTPSIATARTGDCSAETPHGKLTPLAPTTTSSAIALAEDTTGRTLALVVDEDEKVVRILDVEARRELSATSVGGTPSHVLLTRDGRAIVTLRDAAKVEVLSLAERENEPRLVSRCTVATSVEPIALAESPNEGGIVVTTGWGHTLDVLEHRDLAVRAHIDLPREPRGVHIAQNGTSAVVTHLIGSKISVVDLKSGDLRQIDTHGPKETRRITINDRVVPPEAPKRARNLPPTKPAGPSFATREATLQRHSINGVALAMIDKKMIGPRVLVDPGEPDEIALYYGSADRPSETPDVVILDERLDPIPRPEKKLTGIPLDEPPDPQGPGCHLPRAIVENTDEHTALVACLGSNTLLEYALTVDRAPRAVVRQRWPVAAGPVAVAYDARRRQAVVWSTFDHAATFVPMQPLPSGKDGITRLTVARPQSLTREGELDADLGRRLYHTTNDTRISREGLACASCHPDGRDDALTWTTQDGPRNVPMLAGRLAGTEPYAWSGNGRRLADHLQHTIARLGGSGLSPREFEALATYCLSMKTYGTRIADASTAKVARGKQIFDSADAKCASCHQPGLDKTFTDQKKHDVGSATIADRDTTFDTPSLRFVGSTAPYFHDGRYPSLRELLTKSSGKMGQTAHLSPADLDALESYLKTL